MDKEKIERIREIVRKNPQILDSLHPFEREVVMKLCKGLNLEKAQA